MAIGPGSGAPIAQRTTRFVRLNSSATVYTASTARYLPSSTSEVFAGRVKRSSSVPSFRSSAQAVIVMAGTRNSSRTGNPALSRSSVARFALKNAVSKAIRLAATVNATMNR